MAQAGFGKDRAGWIKSQVRSVLLIILGIGSASFGLESFLVPNGYIDGGVTGISLLVKFVTKNFPLSILLVIFNAPFILLGLKQVSREFALKSILAIAGLALAIQFIHFPVLTEDPLLIGSFGGLFLGVGIGFAMRGGAVLDGTEVLAIYLSRNSRMSIGDIILMFNIMIFLAGAYLISVEVALYAILTYFVASKAVNYIIEGIEEYTGVTIISDFSEEIREMLVHELGYGVTLYEAKKGFTKKGELPSSSIYVVYTVVTRLEISRVQDGVNAIDPKAFIIMNSVKDTVGGMIRKRAVVH
ncbi:MAG: YitT family protein [Saprospiraceae bacterium]|nr:YitT family protein [Saprospiraceae bacterium]